MRSQKRDLKGLAKGVSNQGHAKKNIRKWKPHLMKCEGGKAKLPPSS